MVAGGSIRGCNQQNCSPTASNLITSQAIRSYHSSPDLNDQNRDTVRKSAQNQNKGIKRRNELADGIPTVILGSASTNVSHQQATYQKNDASSTAAISQTVARCSIDKCSAYSTPSPQAQVQSLVAETGHNESSNDGGNDGGCESCYDGEDYDYESILAKIINEKKLVSVYQYTLTFMFIDRQPKLTGDRCILGFVKISRGHTVPPASTKKQELGTEPRDASALMLWKYLFSLVSEASNYKMKDSDYQLKRQVSLCDLEEALLVEVLGRFLASTSLSCIALAKAASSSPSITNG